VNGFEEFARHIRQPVGKLGELGEFSFEAVNVRPIRGLQINQGPDQKIALRSEPFQLSLVGYPLVAQDL
jgi:hypothetical protein